MVTELAILAQIPHGFRQCFQACGGNVSSNSLRLLIPLSFDFHSPAAINPVCIESFVKQLTELFTSHDNHRYMTCDH
jgi:hypothetical protein